MEHTFYVNVLFGKNKTQLFNELAKIITSTKPTTGSYAFQIHPFRINPIEEMNSVLNSTSAEILRLKVEKHMRIMDDINNSTINSLPFKNLVFVNYTTKELRPALLYNRVRYYLCDYINEDNIEVLTIKPLMFVNFMKKIPPLRHSINSVFVSYSSLSFYDTDAERRVSDSTTLDIGSETNDDVTYILQAQVQNMRMRGDVTGGIILPYHPFKHSLFTSSQNVKDNLNALQLEDNKQSRLLYYPFDQDEWLVILRNLMYERVLLNCFVSRTLYAGERLSVNLTQMHTDIIGRFYRQFRDMQRKNKTQIINDMIFNHKNIFINNSRVYAGWFNQETSFVDSSSQLELKIMCTQTSTGLFI